MAAEQSGQQSVVGRQLADISKITIRGICQRAVSQGLRCVIGGHKSFQRKQGGREMSRVAFVWHARVGFEFSE